MCIRSEVWTSVLLTKHPQSGTQKYSALYFSIAATASAKTKVTDLRHYQKSKNDSRVAFDRAESIREVQRLGRTAKEIAAEIGEELIKVKQTLDHGQFMPWVRAHCTFGQRTAEEYRKAAKAKSQHAENFSRCNSIREVLALGKTPKEPPKQTRSATLDDLRKVERLRAPIKDQLSRPTYGTL